MADGSEKVVLARIGGTHGVKGEVRVASFTEDPLDFAKYGDLSDRAGRKYEVVSARQAKSVLVVKFKGVDSPEAAKALNGTELVVDRDSLPEPDDPDEFYREDLVGLTVQAADGEPVGRIVAIHDYGAGEIVEIAGKDGKGELFVFTHDNFPEIDIAGGVAVFVRPDMVEADEKGG